MICQPNVCLGTGGPDSVPGAESDVGVPTIRALCVRNSRTRRPRLTSGDARSVHFVRKHVHTPVIEVIFGTARAAPATQLRQQGAAVQAANRWLSFLNAAVERTP